MGIESKESLDAILQPAEVDFAEEMIEISPDRHPIRQLIKHLSNMQLFRNRSSRDSPYDH